MSGHGGLVVVKVGGSLLRAQQGRPLRDLCLVLSGLAGAGHRLLVVPGGGPFADQVREYGRLLSLREESCHHMAILAMDQYAYLLHDLCPRSYLTRAPARTHRAGMVPILLSSSLLSRVPQTVLPRTWAVTSDSVAAYVAGLTGARLLVLLKSTDGVLSSTPGGTTLIPCLAPDKLPYLRTLAEGEPVVDDFFPHVLPAGLPVWVVNGLHPVRLCQLLETGHTVGTFIPPGPRQE